jgi:antitoxin component YwqK of YwqJK toxin-antitoxin module/TolA-binding protein
MKKIVFSVLLLWVVGMHAQEKIPFIDPYEIFNQSGEAAKNGKLEESIELLKKINPNDSLYAASLKDRSYYLMRLKKYEEALSTAELGMDLITDDSKSTFYINKSVALIRLKRYEEALSTLNAGLTKFPVNPLLHYNKGICFIEMGDIKAASDAIQTTIQYSPFYATAHLKLGNLCYKQGLFAQAMMCFNSYLLINPDSEASAQILKSFNSNVKTKYPEKDSSISLSKDDSNFDNIDLILNSHIALQDRYDVDTDINIALTKQNHALLAEIGNIPKADDFWGNYYIPLFEWIQKNDLFSLFTYTVSFSIQGEEYQKIIQKKTKEVKEFLQLYYEQWTRLIRERTVEQDGKSLRLYSNYNDSDKVTSYGPINGNKVIDTWHYFYDSGELKATGAYNENEEREGRWTWYFKDGTVKEVIDYEKGIAQGKNLIYYKDGSLSIDAEGKDQKLDGAYLYYQKGGALSQKKYFKEGKLNGPYVSYFAVGEILPEFNIQYKNDSIQGTLIEYYSNGAIYKESFYNKGILEKEKKYYIDGTLNEENNFKNGRLDGPYAIYHPNKQLAQEGQAIDGDYEGLIKTYYRDGQLESEFTYEKGAINGLTKNYDTDGKLHYELTYRKGELIAFAYYDKSGAILSEGKKKGGEFQFQGHNPDGSILSKGLYDVSGGKKGTWSFHSPYGVMYEKGNYVNDQPDGKYLTYYDSGSPKIVRNFVEGNETGYNVEYHLNGKIKQHGYYVDGLLHGEWRSYYLDGTLKMVSFNHKGKSHGVTKFYGVEGKLSTEIFYEYDEKIKEIAYDHNGNTEVLFDLYNPQAKEVIETKYSNGQTEYLTSYVNKVKHGPYKKFGFDGTLLVDANFVNGQFDGKATYYYENGNKQFEYNYLAGDFNGEQRTYHENGKVSDKETYVNGSAEGTDYSYHENGKLSIERTFVENQLHGKYKFYGVKGNLQIIRHYNHGKIIGYSYLDKNGKEIDMIPLKNGSGKVTAYYDNGNKSRVMEYFNGRLINDYEEYYYDGSLERKIQFVEGKYNGQFVEYHPNGKLKTESSYLYGDRHGAFKSYYDNGQLKSVINFLNDVESGEEKSYTKRGKLTKEATYHNGIMTSLKK